MPLRSLAERLLGRGFGISLGTLSDLLRNTLDLGRRKIQKQIPLGHSEDRQPQFENLTSLRAEYAAKGWPVLSVDTKKKELLGQYAHDGKAWTDGVLKAFDHDFGSYSVGKAIPYGVYDTVRNEALVYLATGSDTGELAADALRRWWFRLGKQAYEGVGGMLVLADCGGSNGYNVALYREQLSLLAARLGVPIRVAHLPPYCSKYNPIDHRLFCHLSRSLSGRLCESLQWMQLIFSRVTTQTGLRVVAELAKKVYEPGQKASDAFRQCESTVRDEILGKYNYVLPVSK
jgi:hypothetical protein